MTLIDALVTTLSLDTTKFKAGQKEANASLKAMGEGATKTGADVQKVAQGMANSFARVTTEVLGLLGLFLAGKGIGTLTRDVTNQDAALGRLSSRLGISTQDLSAWDQAAQSAGAAAGETMGGIATLSQAFEKFQLTGQGGDSFIPYLSRLGVHLHNANGELKSATEQQLEFARAFQAQDKIDPKATDFLGGQIPGMTQGQIDFLRRGPDFVQQRLDKQRAIGLPTRQDAINAQNILEQLGYVDQRAQTFGRHLLNDVSPGITRVLTRLGDWLDRHLPGWYAKIDPIIQGFMGSLEKLNFDHVAADIVAFGKSVRDTFAAIAESWPFRAIERMLGVGAAGGGSAPEQKGGGDQETGSPVTTPSLGDRVRRFLHLGEGVGGQKAIDYFVAQGWTPEQAAGIAGNLQQESGFRPEAGFNADGTPGAHTGIAQWDKTRREAIEEHFGKKLGDMSYDEQLAAVQYELTQGARKAAGDKLRRETTAGGAAISVSHNYEVPVSSDDPDAAKKWADEDARRKQYAESQFRDYPGTGKRQVANPGGFWDPPPDVPRAPAVWTPNLAPPWHVPPPIPLLPEDGRDYPGDGAAEKPDPDGARRFLSGQGAQPPAPEKRMAPIGAGAFLVTDAKRRWAQETHNTVHHDNRSETHVGAVHVHSQAKDAHGIARDVKGALQSRLMATQANRGLA